MTNQQEIQRRLGQTENDVLALYDLTSTISKNLARHSAEFSMFTMSVDQRFNAVDQRFTGIEQRFDGLEQRFDGLEQRFDGLEQRFDGLEQRFDGLEQRFDGLGQRLDTLDGHMTDVLEILRTGR